MTYARLGIEDVTYPDSISPLPDDLLLKILSLVPISEAMKTSLLSKRWKSLWKMMSTLVYDEYSCSNIGSLGFDEFCGRSLQLHEAPVLKNLTLILRKYFNDLDTLLFPNIRSTLLNITITSTSYLCYFGDITFLSNVDVFKSLVTMKLHGNILLNVVDPSISLPSLKSLYLIRVRFWGEEDFTRLLSACSVLEDLFFERCTCGRRSFFNISVPSLQRLHITRDDVTFGNDSPSFEITAPSLKYLKIFERVGCFNFIEDMPNLVEANVSVNLSKNGKLLKFLNSVEHLSIDLYPSVVLDLTDRLIFNRLLHLKLNTCKNIRSKLLLSLLNDFPNLRVLQLTKTYPGDHLEDQHCFGFEPSSVPKCLSFHLQTLQWIGYGGTLGEKEVAGYILKNAHCLKNVTVRLHSKGMENDLIVMKELESMYKASTLCNLVVQV